jgi:uncharacterized protein with HEPN domain
MHRLEAALRGVLENIELARTFASGLSLAEFKADPRTAYATARCLGIISESSGRLPDDLKARHPQIAWIAGPGSIYRREYHCVDDEFVWKTIQDNLESLQIVVEQELKSLAE